MDNEYTPTTDEVRDAWASWTNAFSRGRGIGKDEFDRWLAAEKAKWQAEAWERGAAAPRMQDGSELPAVDNPYKKGSGDER